MVHRRQGNPGPQKAPGSALRVEKKTQHTLLPLIEEIFEKCRPAFKQDRTERRAFLLAMSQLLCMGRHTLTGLLCTAGRQFEDWSADYRLFSRSRFDQGLIFRAIRQSLLDEVAPGAPLVIALDDSLLSKSGKKTPGVAWRRDPLGPPFHTNFIMAQRVLQTSAAIARGHGPSPAQMIPIDFAHAPTPKKPKPSAPQDEWKQYRQLQSQHTISKEAAGRLLRLRSELDQAHTQPDRPLWAVVDGRFANHTFLKSCPERTTIVARIRGDAKLHRLPAPPCTRSAGRRLRYGEREKTPEALLKDPAIPWQLVKVFAAGKLHQCKVKSLSPLLWRPAGWQTPLRLIAIAPLRYQPRKGGRPLYRKPAYLICTDPSISLQHIIQSYIWRWDIEQNFRDEKQLIGVGEAQVRSLASIESAPALAVAAYAMLRLASHKAYGYRGLPFGLPPPKWRTRSHKPRLSTRDLIHQLRAELWGSALELDNSLGFMCASPHNKKPKKYTFSLSSTVLYAA